MAMQRKLIILAITAMFMEVTMAATTYRVGSPNGGWNTNTDLNTWASPQKFFVGDSLLFQYTTMHSVLEVSKADYDLCQTSNPITSDNSGAITIPLSSPGKRYFICGTNGHCGQGMKVEIDTVLAVTSAPPPPSPSSTPPPASPTTPPPASPATPPPASPATPPPASPATPPPASPATPPPASSPSPPAASPVSPPVSSPPPKASTPKMSPPPSLTVPSKSPASTPAPSALVPSPPPSSAHKCSFQATLAMGVGFVMVFLAL